MYLRLFLSSLLGFALACGDDATVGILDSAVDSAPVDAMADTAPPDTGEFSCPMGQHLCGAGCVDDLANDPENGCRTGCGETCPTPPLGVASCNAMGECDFTCEPPSVRDGDTCACTAMTCEEQGLSCGMQTDGCGMDLDCGTCMGGATCTDGVCACEDDAAEDNDARFMAYGIGTYDDGGSSMTFDAFNLSAMDDEDWYVADIEDATNLSSSPDIDVRLTGIPMGADFDLAAYFICDSGTEEVTCVPGAPDNMIGAGCASMESGTMNERVRLETNCTGTLDETGTLFIHVTSSAWDDSCAPYTLAITVD